MMWTLVWIAICLMSVSGQDTGVCVPPPNSHSGVPRPSFPMVYSVRTECNLIKRNKTATVQEWYDGPNNRAVISQTEDGNTALGYFDYNTNQLISVQMMPDGTSNGCKVTDLSKSDSNFMFGLQRFRNNTDKIYPAGSAFQFGGKDPEEYQGRHVVRGIPTDAWTSCVFWAPWNVTMNVTWYFSALGGWQTASNTSQIPVRCHVTGKHYYASGGSHYIDHVYDFFDFVPYIDPRLRVFDFPDNTVCQGRKLTLNMTMPGPNVHFKARLETIVPSYKVVSFMNEWYDVSAKISQFQYRRSKSYIYGSNPLTEVHDYNTGIAFVIDNIRGNCTVAPIPTNFTSMQVDPHHVRMGTLRDFYNREKGTLAYNGVKRVRGIDCDVWVAMQNNIPMLGLGVNVTVEWYFATAAWLTQKGYKPGSFLPVMSSIKTNALSMAFHVYDYSEKEPSLLDYDISPCFDSAHKKDLHFKIPASYRKYVQGDIRTIKQIILTEVSSYLSISRLRVNNIGIDFLSNNELLVKLRLLGATPSNVTGDVLHPRYQLPLQDALQILKHGIDTGNFSIRIMVDGQWMTWKPKPYSSSTFDTVIEEHPWKIQKLEYTGASVVGLGVAMVLIGFGLGFIIFLVIKKRRSR